MQPKTMPTLTVPKELAQRAAVELARRKATKKLICDDAFPKQAGFVRDTSRYVAAKCTRRAGKSHGLGFKFFNAAIQHPQSQSVYIALTRESAKNIMWPIFNKLNDQFQLDARFKESALTIDFPNQSQVRLVGADQKNFIDRLKGPKYPMAGIDEAQAFGGHLKDLVDEVLDPAVADYLDGQIVLTGTPGPVPKGYFYEASQGKYGFKTHFFTVYDNPYFPRPREYTKEMLEKKGWTPSHPTFRREWLGEWVSDPDALVYKFNATKNLTARVPASIKEWFYVLGVDLGYDPDPSAFVLCAYSQYDRHLYVVDTYKQTKMNISDVAERINYYLRSHPYAQVIIDAGALGKMIAEEIKARYGVPLIAAEKQGKDGFIEILNADLENGLIKIIESKSEELVDEMLHLIWDTEKDKRVEDARYPNHLCFVAGTKISTGKGLKNIETLTLSDRALTRNGYKNITAIGLTGEREVMTLYFSNKESLTCTPEHPIYNLDQQSYIPARDLKVWDQMFGLSATEKVFLSRRAIHKDTPKKEVYNLTVDEGHEYFANGILVSNCDATLYAWRYCYNYAWAPKPTTPKPHSDESMDAWWDAEADNYGRENDDDY